MYNKLSYKKQIELDLYSLELIERFNLKEYNKKFIRDLLIHNKISFNEMEYNYLMYRFKNNLNKSQKIFQKLLYNY